jgi:hypothetical protein
LSQIRAAAKTAELADPTLTDSPPVQDSPKILRNRFAPKTESGWRESDSGVVEIRETPALTAFDSEKLNCLSDETWFEDPVWIEEMITRPGTDEDVPRKLPRDIYASRQVCLGVQAVAGGIHGPDSSYLPIKRSLLTSSPTNLISTLDRRPLVDV